MTPCPYCAKSASSLFIAHDRNRHISRASFPYYRCISCGLIFLRVEFDELASKVTLWEKMVYLTMLRIGALGTRLVPRGLRYKLMLIRTILVIISKTPQLDPQKNDRSIKISLRYSNRLTRSGIALKRIISSGEIHIYLAVIVVLR